jgi:hypothetical protein
MRDKEGGRMKKYLKRKFQKWLLEIIQSSPEWASVSEVYYAIKYAKADMTKRNISCNYIVLVSPNMNNCRVLIHPKIQQDITLSKVGIEAMLNISGTNSKIMNSIFSYTPIEKKEDK